jgi:hypothetical protein
MVTPIQPRAIIYDLAIVITSSTLVLRSNYELPLSSSMLSSYYSMTLKYDTSGIVTSRVLVT